MERIRQGSLHDAAAGRIRALIEDGQLAPGSRIPEKRLCAEFGVSRTPLREALKVLAAEGLVELLPNRGARVVRLTRDMLEDTFAVMGSLEALSGELACQRITEAELAEVQALHYRMLAHYARREREPYFELNRRIHEALIAAARNEALADVYQRLSMRVRRARYATRLAEAHWAQAVADHEAMIEALRARDGERLARILRAHLRHKLEMFIASGFVCDLPADGARTGSGD